MAPLDVTPLEALQELIAEHLPCMKGGNPANGSESECCLLEDLINFKNDVEAGAYNLTGIEGGW